MRSPALILCEVGRSSAMAVESSFIIPLFASRKTYLSVSRVNDL
jgi:hypothetical protein